MDGYLLLEDGTKIEGKSFGSKTPVAGEVVFTTGMVGYPQALTDPSYKGQLLVFTYPLLGNYGVADKKFWESDFIQARGIIVSTYNKTPSHSQSTMSLSEWLIQEKIPGLEIDDTRFLAMKIREQGTMLGKIVFNAHDEKTVVFADPNKENLVEQASRKEVLKESVEGAKKTLILFDCGAKKNIRMNVLKRGINLITVPWDYDIFENGLSFDGIIFSNGPGDPKMAKKTIAICKKALDVSIPILGICLGNQILCLAAGGDTYKLKFGHRSQNQPAQLANTKRCYLTTQNHGFAVGKIPRQFKPWFVNANDQTNEGIIHTKKPWMSVQFHPEATPGPVDTEWIFDYFIEKL